MSNTNYGKFKAIPTTQVSQPYVRGAAAGQGQYLPKLGGTNAAAGQSQLTNYQQMMDRQQHLGSNLHSTSQQHLSAANGP